MEADVKWCPSCKLKGKTKRLKLFQINSELAALLCDNEECVNLGEISSVSSRIVPRKSSDIPIRKKRRPNPIPASTPKMPNALSQPSPPGSQSSTSPHGMSSESHRLLKTVPSLEAMPQVRLWRNRSALCWLDACMFVLVSCRSLRACLVRLPEKSLVRTLCNAFERGQRTQHLSQSNESWSQADANSDEKPEDSNTPSDSRSPTPSQSNRLTIPSSAPDSHDSLELCNAKPMQNNQDPAQVVAPVSGSDRESGDPLDDVRDKLFLRLQTKLQCQLGREDSPVFALPALLRLDETVEEHFLCRYRWEFYCDACGHADIIVNKKTVLTLPSVPADFNMANPSMLQHCPQCRSHDQKSHLVFHSFPACVMLHFQDGLSDGDIMKHSTFMQGGETYTLSTVVRYRQNPNHFITLLRDPESDHWLEYDDILPSPFTWQQRAPHVPAKEIHLLIWERVDTPCTACIRMYSDVTALRESLAHSTLSSIPERKLNTNTPQSRDSLRNRKSVTRDCEGSSPSVLQSGAEHHANDGHKAQCSKEVTDSGLDRSIHHPKSQEAVVDLTSSDTHTATANGGVAVTNVTTPYSSPLLNSHLEATAERSLCLPKGPLSALNHLRRFRPSMTKKDIEGSKQIEPITAANTSASTKQKTQRRPQSFLEKVNARRKGKPDERDAGNPNKPNTLSVLGKIPQQMLKFSGPRTRAKVVNTENEAQQNCASPRKEDACRTPSVLSQISKQPLPSAVNGKLLMTHSKHGTRGKNIDSVRGGSTNRGKFQPYSCSVVLPERLGGVSQDRAPHKSIKAVGPLNSWQKRVGMFSAASSTASKRVRRDSTEENSFCDKSKQTWYPSSSVSSPSACSDVSSLSDNQSFASGRDDLAATIEELCKTLGSDYSCTPSVSSRFSSPSQDMFFSETLSDVGASFTLDDIFNEESCLLDNDSEHQWINSDHHIPEQPGVENASDTHTRISSMHPCSEPSTAHSQPSSLPLHTSSPDIAIGSSNYLRETPDVPIMEGTLPSVDRTCSTIEPNELPPKPLMHHFARSPSCVASGSGVSTVAMQPDLPGSNNSTCDSLIPSHARSTFNSLSDTTTGAITSSSLASSEAVIEGHNDLDDILMDSRPFEGNVDFIEMDWSINFVELLA